MKPKQKRPRNNLSLSRIRLSTRASFSLWLRYHRYCPYCCLACLRRLNPLSISKPSNTWNWPISDQDLVGNSWLLLSTAAKFPWDFGFSQRSRLMRGNPSTALAEAFLCLLFRRTRRGTCVDDPQMIRKNRTISRRSSTSCSCFRCLYTLPSA